MSLREELHEEIDRVPETLLPSLFRYLRELNEESQEIVDPRPIEERRRALREWGGHLKMPALPADAFDREAIYQDGL